MERGQAAVEFLLTYGWALLVVIATVGALAYFGVMNPQGFGSERCVVSAGFDCKNVQFVEFVSGSGTAEVMYTLSNSQNTALRLEVPTHKCLSDCESGFAKGDNSTAAGQRCGFVSSYGAATNPSPSARLLEPAQTAHISCSVSATEAMIRFRDPGAMARLDLRFNYTYVGQSSQHHGTGEIISRVRQP